MLTLLFAALTCLTVLGNPPAEGPPGLLPVKGGKTKIGSTPKQVEDLVLAREEIARVMAGETPQFTHDVDDFLLMPSEVTNEQYAQFVTATGARPPRSWGTAALQAGQAAFLEEQGKAKQAARAAGQPFEPKIFDPEIWWAENWSSAKWEVPPDGAALPVTFVTYAEAQSYARWAGLRLMSEFEFRRAARGDSARDYPWGDDWDDRKYCQSLLTGKDQPAAVGSYPEGALNGFFDLAGNVWEWTSTPYDPYPGYAPLRIKTGKRTIEGMAAFDPNQRVIVSGSFHTDRVGVRASTRMNADRIQSTNAIGFRCAASPKPGVDAANALIEQKLRMSVIGNAELAPVDTMVLRRWETVPGQVKLPGYAVISAYQHVLFCPRKDVSASSSDNLADLTLKEGPVFIGFLDLPRPMLRPELDAGTYFVAWRAAGELPKGTDSKQGLRIETQEAHVTPFHEVTGFAADKNCFIFYDAQGEPQVAMEAPAPKTEKARSGSVANEPFVAPDPKTLPKDTPPPKPIDTLRFTIPVGSATSRSKAFFFDLAILVAPGTYDDSWK